jgi:hypothetical protein
MRSNTLVALSFSTPLLPAFVLRAFKCDLVAECGCDSDITVKTSQPAQNSRGVVWPDRQLDGRERQEFVA